MSALPLIASLQADPLRAAAALALAAAIAWAVGQWLGASASQRAAALAAAAAPKAPPPVFTRAQVAEHGTKEDLWVVIGKKVCVAGYGAGRRGERGVRAGKGGNANSLRARPFFFLPDPTLS